MPDFTITLTPQQARIVQTLATRAGVPPNQWILSNLPLARGFGSEFHDALREQASVKRNLVDAEGTPRVMTHEEAAGTDVLEMEVFGA